MATNCISKHNTYDLRVLYSHLSMINKSIKTVIEQNHDKLSPQIPVCNKALNPDLYINPER